MGCYGHCHATSHRPPRQPGSRRRHRASPGRRRRRPATPQAAEARCLLRDSPTLHACFSGRVWSLPGLPYPTTTEAPPHPAPLSVVHRSTAAAAPAAPQAPRTSQVKLSACMCTVLRSLVQLGLPAQPGMGCSLRLTPSYCPQAPAATLHAGHRSDGHQQRSNQLADWSDLSRPSQQSRGAAQRWLAGRYPQRRGRVGGEQTLSASRLSEPHCLAVDDRHPLCCTGGGHMHHRRAVRADRRAELAGPNAAVRPHRRRRVQRHLIRLLRAPDHAKWVASDRISRCI